MSTTKRSGSVAASSAPPEIIPFRGGTPSIGSIAGFGFGGGFGGGGMAGFGGGLSAAGTYSKPRKSQEEESIETRLKEAKKLYKIEEYEKAAAGFKWVRAKAAERWMTGVEPRDAFARLRDMQVDAQISLGWALLRCAKREKGHQAFHDALALSKEFGDRVNEVR